MAHIYKANLWQSSSGKWMVVDTEDLANGSGQWWIPARVAKISLTDFILLLKDKFNVSNLEYLKNTCTLLFSWDNKADANRYKNWINSEAKKNNAII